MRPIDADLLTDYLKCLFPERGTWEINGDTAKDAICETVVEAMEMVKNMETVKLPRKTGRWVSVGCVIPSLTNVPMIKCTVCGHLEPDVDVARTPYCSHCGSRMGGVPEDV